MSANVPGGNKSKADGNGGWKYVKCDLTAEQKGSLKYWAENDAKMSDMLAWLDKRVAGGHTISVKSQEVNYHASVTGVRESSGHKDVALTAWGSSPSNALLALWYKDSEVLTEGWVALDKASEVDL